MGSKPIDGLSLLRRFVAKIERHNECWLWTGGLNSKGYPALWVGSSMKLAHRVSHELFIGQIPEGEQVHHRCMNPRCVNPEHLEAVTPERNRYLQAIGAGTEDEIPF